MSTETFPRIISVDDHETSEGQWGDAWLYDDLVSPLLMLSAAVGFDALSMDQSCFETDYPHAQSTCPNTKKMAEEMCQSAGLDDEEVYKLMRGNAIRAFGLERFGISK